jgi:hypothetical protein
MVLSQRLSLVLRGGVSVLRGGQVVGTRPGADWEDLRTPENLISLRHGHCANVARPEERNHPEVDYPPQGVDAASSRAGRSASRAGVLSRTATFSVAGTPSTTFRAKEGTCLAAAISARLLAREIAFAGKSLTLLPASMRPSRLGVQAEVGRREVHQSIWCKQASRTPPVSMWVRGA